MNPDRSRRALASADVWVAMSAAALLAGLVLLLTMQLTRSGKRGACLSNLRTFGMGSHMYAADDSKELLIPIHPRMLTPTDKWYWRSIHAFVSAGASGKKKLMFDDSDGLFLNDAAGEGRGTPGEAWDPLESTCRHASLSIL